MKKNLTTLLFLAYLKTNLFAQRSVSLNIGFTKLITTDYPIPSFQSRTIGITYQYDFSKRSAIDVEARYGLLNYKYIDLFRCENCITVFDPRQKKFLNSWYNIHKLSFGIAYNYRILEKKWFQWRIASGVYINDYLNLTDNQFMPIIGAEYQYNASFVGKNYFNIKMTQNLDLQLLTTLNLSDSFELDDNYFQYNLGVRYKFDEKTLKK